MIINTDALASIPLCDESVQCVVTSPPYWGLRDYGVDGQLGLEKTPEEYVANMVTVFREVRRVLKADGLLWLNLGDSFLPDKNLAGIPWRVAFALQADGWWLRSDIIWAKPNPMPESVTDRPTRAHEYLFLLTKSARYYYDADAIKESVVTSTLNDKRLGIATGTNRPRYSTDGMASCPSGMAGGSANGRNKRSVWTIATQPTPDAHFATFPEKLVEPCVLAGSRFGDIVLDPFSGSGTTIKVAHRLGRKGVGCELNREYIKIAERKCWQDTRQGVLA